VNDQRKAVFEQRQEFMDADRSVRTDRRDAPGRDHRRPGRPHLPPKAYAEQWDIDGLDERVARTLGMELPLPSGRPRTASPTRRSRSASSRRPTPGPPSGRPQIGSDQMRGLEKNFLLQMVDMQWREHLVHLDHLRNVIGLRGYGQRDPLNEYKTEAFSLFEKLLWTCARTSPAG
jgi:preprotein translocase subunit SecA